MFKRISVIAIIIALVVAVFPVNVFAASIRDTNLENQWDKLVTAYQNQSVRHEDAHRWADAYMKSKKASGSDKSEVSKHLAICNSSFAAASTLIATHPGFDAYGNVTNRYQATNSIKSLSAYIQLHAGSVRNLRAHTN